jgi:hypothetical protein
VISNGAGRQKNGDDIKGGEMPPPKDEGHSGRRMEQPSLKKKTIGRIVFMTLN